jgi:DNA-binding transcriptional MerR regulator
MEAAAMEASIQEVARLAGTTSRTLRHYDAIGLLAPTRIGHQGYRYYDTTAMVRLQRILLLRYLGLGLEQIRQVLDAQTDEVAALRAHLAWLEDETGRLARLRATVERTINALEKGTEIMADGMLDGFDHTQYKDEVTQRWGADAYAAGDAWWRGMTEAERSAWKQRQEALAADWTEAAAARVDPASAEAQALAERHVGWLADIPGTPQQDGRPAVAYVLGLGDMYVADPRFAKNYGGGDGAAFVRDALRLWAESHRA